MSKYQSFFGDFFLLVFFFSSLVSSFWKPQKRAPPTKAKKTAAYKNFVKPGNLWNEMPNILISFYSEAYPEAAFWASLSSLLTSISSSNCLMNLTMFCWLAVNGVSKVSAMAE